MKQGYHAVYSKNYFDGIDSAVKYGFDFVQFDLGVPQFFLNEKSDTELTQIYDYALENEVEITFHTPGDNVSLFCDYPLIRKGILDEFKLILDKANLLNVHHVTFHTGNYPQFKMTGCKTFDLNLDYYAEILYDNLMYLTERSGNVLVCIENWELNTLKLNVIKRLLKETDLYLTLDTAKIYNGDSINEEVYEFYVHNRERIRELHIHDRNTEYGSHQIVGTGTVDFTLFTQFINSEVYINHEVRPVESAKISCDNFNKGEFNVKN